MLSLPLLLIISDRVEESAVKNATPNNTSIGRKKAALNNLDIKSVAIITIIKLIENKKKKNIKKHEHRKKHLKT